MRVDRATETSFEELMRYVRFTDEDARLLVAVAPHVQPAFGRIAHEFYDRVREHEAAHAVFTSEEQVRRLQASLVVWLEGVFGGVYDAAYFERIEKIGRAHVRVGLPQRYVIAAMAVVQTSLAALIASHAGSASLATREALARLLDVELAVMLEIHHGDAITRLERASQLNVVEEAVERHLEVIDLAPVFVVALDRNGMIELFNPAAERATGWARDEVRGRSFVELFVPEAERAAVAARLANDPVVTHTFRTRSGKVRTVRWNVTHAPAGSTFAFGCDVTEEQATREHESQKMRLASAGTLVAGLAHEIRNPLNGAGLHVAFLERALAKEGPPETLEAVRTIGTELRRLASLVTEFLDLARPMALAHAPVDARALCERAIHAVAATAESAKVRIATDYPTHDVVFDGDVARLEKVVGHLLENAVDALRETGGDVMVRLRRHPRHVWIEVEDNGPGVQDPDAPIFDAFYSTKPEGAGLGLAIVHRVITDHEGAIDVESRAGYTCFRLRIPLTRGKES